MDKTSKKLPEVYRFFNLSLELLCIAGPDATFLRVNPAFTKVLGYTEEELISKPFLEFIHPEDIPKTLEEVKKLTEGHPTINFENRYRHVNGTYRIFSWSASPDPDTGFLYAAARDVTEQREIEEKLIQSNNSIDSHAIVAVTDRNGVITEANENFSKLSGYSKSELIGQNHRILNSGAHPKEFFKDLWQTISSGKSWNGVIENRNKSGKSYWVQTFISPIFDGEKKISGYRAIRFDITEQKQAEAALNEAQSISKIGSWEFDLTNHYLTWSKEHYRIFEIKEPQSQEHLYQLYRNKIHPDDVKQLDIFIAEAKLTGAAFTFDHRIIFENKIKYVQGIAKGTLDASGKCIKLSGICQDLTEKKEKDLETQFIIDSLALGIWKFDPNTNALEWDKSMYTLFGVEQKDFSGAYEAWEKALTPEAKEKAVSELKLALKGEKEFNTIFEIQLNTGEKRHIAGRAVVIRNNKNEPIKMYGVNWDVTKNRNAEIALSEKEELISIVLKTLPLAVFGKDIQNDYQWTIWNQYAENLFGIKAKDCLGKFDRDFFPKEQADFFRIKDIEASQTTGVIDIPEEFAQTSKGTVLLHTRKIVIRNEKGEPKILLGITEDITEKKAKEKELLEANLRLIHSSKMASLGELSAGIAHEINNPLAIISGSINLILNVADKPDKLAEKIATIHKATIRISKIVSGLKKFSRSADTGHYNHLILSKIVKEALILTQFKSKKNGTPVITNLKSESCIFCNEVEIEQVLVNLIDNAIDAVKSQEEKWVKLELIDDEKSVILKVTDSGRGIPEEVQKKLFDPFFTTKVVGEGTGLGLSITKGILEEHKASIRLIPNAPNTCFEIRFPRVAV